MKYFVPDIRLIDQPLEAVPAKKGWLARVFGRGDAPTPATTIAKDGANASERLGGTPWSLPRRLWPTCRECGRSQSLLAQFDHHPYRLDLGRSGRRLFVFQCAHDPGMCDTWEAFSGANACLVVEPEDLEDKSTETPDDAPPTDNGVYIAGWQERDDGIDETLRQALLTDETQNLDEATVDKVTYSTRLGGVPSWIQNADERPGPDWRFVGQLDSTYSFLTPPEYCPAWVSIDRERFEGRASVGHGPNFGDGGIAYLFVQDIGGKCAACMFWQCH